MKSNKLLLLILSGFMLIAVASCKKSFFTKVNENPNVPPSVEPPLILPTVEAALGYTQGGDLSRYTSLLMQQMYGANSQSQAIYQYGINPGTFENLWSDLYTSVFENDDTLMHESDAK